MTTKKQAEKPVTSPVDEPAKTAEEQAAGPGTTLQTTPPVPIELGDDGKPKPPEESEPDVSQPKGDPVVAQGMQAKELGLDEEACPYGEGEHRDNWLKGHAKGEAPKSETK